ncbi:MAG: hypothetical protein AVDCRST_MAG56-302 [uncultured Cytophagales bacterium]|uniref:Uncharacterized protein n=1 Tax=uncultured Cytophagales bacterium TaxID=158755 RepID=A0A6J4H930_9SPHI|nr:MAG: hypothetical protein AVDCRST_MAG56-302 [uncultured Cytophagales bacterium]
MRPKSSLKYGYSAYLRGIIFDGNPFYLTFTPPFSSAAKDTMPKIKYPYAES